VLGWDEKSFFARQRLLRGEQEVAGAVVRARFLARSGGAVSPAQVLALLDAVPPPPGIPAWAVAWSRSTGGPAGGQPAEVPPRTGS